MNLYNTEFDCMRYFPLGIFIIDSDTDNEKIHECKEEAGVVMHHIATRMNSDYLDYTASVLEYCGYRISKFDVAERVYIHFPDSKPVMELISSEWI